MSGYEADCSPNILNQNSSQAMLKKIHRPSNCFVVAGLCLPHCMKLEFVLLLDIYAIYGVRRS